MNRLLSTTLVFLFLFAPFLRIGGAVLHLPYLVALLLASWPVLLLLRGKGVSRGYGMFIGVFLLGYVWILMISIVRGVVDWSLQLVYLNGLLSILAAYGLAHIIHRLANGSTVAWSNLIDAVFVAGVAHACIMALAVISPSFSNALYSVVVLGEKGQLFLDQAVRAPGLTTGGGDALSVIQAIALVFGVHRYWQRSGRTARDAVLHFVAFAVLFLSILLSGRTGLVVLGLGLLLLGLHEALRWVRRYRVRRSALVAGLAGSVLIALAAPSVWGLLQRSAAPPVLGRALEPMNMLWQTGRLATASTDRILATMYFMPDSEMDAVVGTGNFGRDSRLPHIPSDVGYVRTIFGAGIIGTALMYLVLFFPFTATRRRAQVDSKAALLVGFLVVAILVVNLKVFHFAGLRESFKVLALCTASLLLAEATTRPDVAPAAHAK
jgi:hypothetical protein